VIELLLAPVLSHRRLAHTDVPSTLRVMGQVPPSSAAGESLG